MQSSEGTLRRRPLRRVRELVCLAAAGILWLVVWAGAHGGYQGQRGHAALAVLAVMEMTALGGLFLLEWRRPRRRPAMPWITMAWLSLPAWCLVEVLVALALQATAG